MPDLGTTAVEITDEELAAEALAAAPDPDLGAGARPWAELVGAGPGLLPGWYMPVPGTVPAPVTGWRRKVAVVIVSAFTTITAYGLCATYGHVGLG